MRRLRWAAALFVLGPASGSVSAQPTPAPPSIRVEGVASREVAPDMAVVTVGITNERPTATDAAAQNNRTAAALLDELKTSGIADRDVVTTQASLDPVFEADRAGNQTSRVRAYRAVNTVEVRVRDLPTVGTIVGRLIDKGANDLQGIAFTVADPKPVVDGLRADAVHDARHKAEIYAEAAGVKLGRVLDIAPETTSAAPFARAGFKTLPMRAAAPVAPTPLQAGTSTFDARVTVTWELLQ